MRLDRGTTHSVQNAVLFSVLALAMALIFQRNMLNLGAPGQFETFQSDAEAMVRNRLLFAKQQGIFSEGGFLLENDEHDGHLMPYRSRTGVQGQIAAIAFVYSGIDLARFTAGSRFVMDLGLSVTLLLFCLIVRQQWGGLAAAIVFMLLLLSNWIAFFAGSLYWVIWTHFLPMTVCFMLYPRLLTGKLSWRVFFLAIGSLIFVKAICGYEFTTNVLLSCTVPVLYYGILNKASLDGIVRIMWRVIVAGAAGLAAAVVIHTIQTSLNYGAIPLAVAHLWERAQVRSFSNPGISYSLPVKVLRNIYRYLGSSLVTLVRMDGQIRIDLPLWALNVALAFCSVFVLADSRFVPGLAHERRKLLAWIAACVWGLVCSMTWFLIALDHTYGHLHMDPVMFYLPYGLLVYGCVAAVCPLAIRSSVCMARIALSQKYLKREREGSWRP
jgi:hypothetical protein